MQRLNAIHLINLYIAAQRFIHSTIQHLNAIHLINLYIAGQRFIYSTIQRLNNQGQGQDYNIILNLVWFRISFLSWPVLIIQMYSVQVTMKFWFTLRTDFTHNIFKCWFTCILTQIKNIMQLLGFRRRKNQTGPIPIIITGIGAML